MRYELKYVFPVRDYGNIEKALYSHPAFITERYYERQINNIYFDTPSLTDYYASVNGASRRVKTRIRWYGKQYGTLDHPALELKYKEGMVGGKHLYPLLPIHQNGGFSWERYYSELTESGDTFLPALGALKTRIPAVVNTYKRRYFAIPDDSIRLTLDKDVRYYSLNRAFENSDLYISSGYLVLEVKFEENAAEWAGAFLDSFCFRIGKNSKYVQAVKAVYFGDAFV